MKYRELGREVCYEGRAFDVHKVKLQLPSEKERYYDLVSHPGAVVILPLDNGKIWFVEQFRLGAGKTLLELPAGVLEKGEDPEVCAIRELREETGFSAKTFKKLGDIFIAPGYSTENLHLFLANDLFEDPLEQDDDEFINLKSIPVKEVFEMVHSGAINDAKTLATLLLAEKMLEA